MYLNPYFAVTWFAVDTFARTCMACQHHHRLSFVTKQRLLTYVAYVMKKEPQKLCFLFL
jgi:hypothetical protein